MKTFSDENIANIVPYLKEMALEKPRIRLSTVAAVAH